MALSTYSELQASVADWWHNDNTSVIVDAIRMTEARMNRRLRTKRQETTLSDTAINASYQIAVPSNTLAVKTLWRTGTPKTYLEPAPLHIVEGRQTQGQNAYFYHFGASVFEFDGTGTVGGILYRDIPALASVSTNWVLTNYPEAYLYGALAECMKWSRDAEGAAMYEGMAEQSIQQIVRTEGADAYSGPLTVRASSYGP